MNQVEVVLSQTIKIIPSRRWCPIVGFHNDDSDYSTIGHCLVVYACEAPQTRGWLLKSYYIYKTQKPVCGCLFVAISVDITKLTEREYTHETPLIHILDFFVFPLSRRSFIHFHSEWCAFWPLTKIRWIYISGDAIGQWALVISMNGFALGCVCSTRRVCVCVNTCSTRKHNKLIDEKTQTYRF